MISFLQNKKLQKSTFIISATKKLYWSTIFNKMCLMIILKNY